MALIIPIALLLFAGALDMGRLFFARLSIENAAREGAFYGATNPRCDTSARAGCSDPHTADWRVRNEASGITGLVTSYACLDAGTPRASVLDCEEGDDYLVTVQDQFDLMTPLLEPILGSSMTLEATATSSVLNPAFDPTATFVPWPTPTPTPTATPTPTPTPPPANCTVSNWIGTRKNAAQSQWNAAGFIPTNFNAVGSGNFTIASQSLSPGLYACTASITVTG